MVQISGSSPLHYPALTTQRGTWEGLPSSRTGITGRVRNTVWPQRHWPKALSQETGPLGPHVCRMDHKQRVPFWQNYFTPHLGIRQLVYNGFFVTHTLRGHSPQNFSSLCLSLAEYNMRVRKTSNPIWIFIYCLDNPLFCLKNSPWYIWV